MLEGDLPIQLKLDAFCLSAKQNRINRVHRVRLVRLSSVIELTSSINRTHRKVPVRLSLITEPVEQQSNRLGSIELIDFWFEIVRLTTPGKKIYAQIFKK